MMKNIDWDTISDAVHYYGQQGYTYVETPWMVPVATSMITCPAEDNIFTVWGNGGLVGSAEQGFLELAMNNSIHPDTKYISAGPCFRDEPVDDLHQKTFFKAELFYYTREQEAAAQLAKDMLEAAYGFMLLRSPIHRPQIVDAGFGWDININGIEVGSYGYRFHERVGFWAYGTAAAEPRFSQATRI
jgi:hypothetical protein